MKSRIVALIMLLVALAGCATVSKDVTFNPAKGETFLLMAADGITADLPGSYNYVFRRVDVANSKFLPETVGIVFDAGVGTFVVHEFAKPASLATTIRFGGRKLVPGDYALVARTDIRSLGMTQHSNVNCYSFGAPVFRILPEKINVVPIGSSGQAGFSEKALAESGEVLAAYPGMTAARVVAERIGSVTFGTAKILGTEVCGKRNITELNFVPETN